MSKRHRKAKSIERRAYRVQCLVDRMPMSIFQNPYYNLQHDGIIYAHQLIIMLSKILGISDRRVTVYAGRSHTWVGTCKAKSEFVVRIVAMPSVLAGQMSVSSLSPTIMQSIAWRPACLRANSKILGSGFFNFRDDDIVCTLKNLSKPAFSISSIISSDWLAIIPISQYFESARNVGSASSKNLNRSCLPCFTWGSSLLAITFS